MSSIDTMRFCVVPSPDRQSWHVALRGNEVCLAAFDGRCLTLKRYSVASWWAYYLACKVASGECVDMSGGIDLAFDGGGTARTYAEVE